MRITEDSHLVRACFVVPSLHYGGAERWTLELARYCDPERVAWTGAVIAHAQWVDRRMLSALSALMPVFHDGCIWERGQREHGVDLGAAVDRLLRPADAAMTWEVDSEIRHILQRAGAHVVNVAHRHDRASLTQHLEPTDSLVTVWPNCRETFGERNSDRVTVIPNGVDLNRCYPLRERAAMRRLWGCDDSSFVVGYLGRIDTQKNCVAVARCVRGLGQGAVGVLVGSWTARAAGVESAIRDVAREGVLICPPVEDVGSVLAAIDVLMLPSASEVCSLTLLEAWAAGVPVVATRVGAVPDLEAQHGQLVVPVGPDAESAELAAAVRCATSGSSELAAMRQRAADLVREHFNVLQMARAWDDYLMGEVPRTRGKEHEL